MAIILKIGDVDLSNYTLCGKVQINKQPVYDSVSFTNCYGKTVKEYIGDSYTINASFENLPSDIVGQIQTACRNDVSITFLSPNETSAIFERPTITASVEWESDEDTQYWNLSLSAVCPLLGDGL